MKEFVFVIKENIVAHIRTRSEEDAIRIFKKQYGDIEYRIIEVKKR